MNLRPEIIDEALEKDWNFVFLINNPVTAIVSKMIIEAYGIDSQNVKAVAIRKTDTSLIGAETIDPGERWTDRFLIKLLRDTPISRRIIATLNSNKKNFILFTAWAYGETNTTPSIERLISSKYCQSICYIEEGQAAYRNIAIGTNQYKKTFYTSDEERLNDREIYLFLCTLNHIVPIRTRLYFSYNR